jgi:four helix bundle protein
MEPNEMHYRDLKVWQKTHALTLVAYQKTKSFPTEERFGLTSQIRRAAVSIEANLAEGSGRVGSAEYGRFVHMALGSARELDCELLARDLGYLSPDDYDPMVRELDQIQRMLVALAGKLSPLASRPSPPG